MNSPPGSNIPDARTITFPSGNQARMIVPGTGVPATSILAALGDPKPKALIMVFGGADHLDRDLAAQLEPFFTRGIARTAAKKDALIIDGGTDSGVMALMGAGVYAQRRRPPLLGVAPSGKVTFPGDTDTESKVDVAQLDSNHSHFVLAAGESWGDETATMFELADELSNGIPVVTLLLNGSDGCKKEVLESVRRGWPVIVVKGSGRLADKISSCIEKKGRLKKDLPDDRELKEIVEEGDLKLFNVECSPNDLEKVINRLILTSEDPSLDSAWQRFAAYDANAGYRQKRFSRIQLWILVLGVLTTFAVLLQQQLIGSGVLVEPNGNGEDSTGSWAYHGFRYVIIILPILISILVAAANRFREGHKWVLLRASAESIKQEIYRYRTRTNKYRVKPNAEKTPPELLIQKIERISSKLMKTDVNAASLRPYDGPLPPEMHGAAAEDDGIGSMTAEQYLRVRLGDQISFYSSRTGKLEERSKLLHWCIYVFGGVGTFLAAVGIELWVALMTTLTGALSAFLEYRQIENTLVQYQQTATALRNVRDWWTALPDVKKQDPANFDQLVEQVENILQTEMIGWVQHMEDAQATLREERTAEARPIGGETAPA